MSILLVVLAALVSVTTSGSKAEHELNLRFQAQEEARLGLDVFRREVHNACGATVAPGGNQVTLRSNAQTGSFPCNLGRLELVHERERNALRPLPAGRSCRVRDGRAARRLPGERSDLLTPDCNRRTAAEDLDRPDCQP